VLSRFEVRKDLVQELTESAATHVGRIATILTGSVRDVTHEVGEWFSDVFEMREAARRAHAEREAAEAADLPDPAEADLRDDVDLRGSDPEPVPDPDTVVAPEAVVATPEAPGDDTEEHPSPAEAAAVHPSVPPPPAV
jgi:hypothetical protein